MCLPVLSKIKLKLIRCNITVPKILNFHHSFTFLKSLEIIKCCYCWVFVLFSFGFFLASWSCHWKSSSRRNTTWNNFYNAEGLSSCVIIIIMHYVWTPTGVCPIPDNKRKLFIKLVFEIANKLHILPFLKPAGQYESSDPTVFHINQS